MKRIILLGDSITEWNPLKHNEILNLGIAGDTTQDILLRVVKVRKLKCRKVIFKTGINDILNKEILKLL